MPKTAALLQQRCHRRWPWIFPHNERSRVPARHDHGWFSRSIQFFDHAWTIKRRTGRRRDAARSRAVHRILRVL